MDYAAAVCFIMNTISSSYILIRDKEIWKDLQMWLKRKNTNWLTIDNDMNIFYNTIDGVSSKTIKDV